MHSLRVLRANLSVGVLNLVQYRSDFVIALVNVAISLAAQVLGLSGSSPTPQTCGAGRRTTCSS